MLNLRNDKINIIKTRNTYSSDRITGLMNVLTNNQIENVNLNEHKLARHLSTMSVGDTIIFNSPCRISIKDDSIHIITINHTFQLVDTLLVNKKMVKINDIKSYYKRKKRLDVINRILYEK